MISLVSEIASEALLSNLTIFDSTSNRCLGSASRRESLDLRGPNTLDTASLPYLDPRVPREEANA